MSSFTWGAGATDKAGGFNIMNPTQQGTQQPWATTSLQTQMGQSSLQGKTESQLATEDINHLPPELKKVLDIIQEDIHSRREVIDRLGQQATQDVPPVSGHLEVVASIKFQTKEAEERVLELRRRVDGQIRQVEAAYRSLSLINQGDSGALHSGTKSFMAILVHDLDKRLRDCDNMLQQCSFHMRTLEKVDQSRPTMERLRSVLQSQNSYFQVVADNLAILQDEVEEMKSAMLETYNISGITDDPFEHEFRKRKMAEMRDRVPHFRTQELFPQQQVQAASQPNVQTASVSGQAPSTHGMGGFPAMNAPQKSGGFGSGSGGFGSGSGGFGSGSGGFGSGNAGGSFMSQSTHGRSTLSIAK